MPQNTFGWRWLPWLRTSVLPAPPCKDLVIDEPIGKNIKSRIIYPPTSPITIGTYIVGKNVSWAQDDKRSQNLISLRACVDHREIMNINLQSRLKFLAGGCKYFCITHIKMDPAHYWIRYTKKAMIIRLIFIDFYFDLLRSYQSWGQRPSGSYLWSNRGIRMESEHICLNTSHDLFSLILYFWPPEFIDILRSSTYANTKYMLNSLWTRLERHVLKETKYENIK